MVDLAAKLREKYASEIEEAKTLGNDYPPDLYGRFPWDRSERRGKTTTLAKASIGDFVFNVLRCGGSVDSIYPFAPNYHRSAVMYRVHLSISQKKLLEETTAYRFDPPPTVKLC